MPTIVKRRNVDRTLSYMASVRIEGCKRTAKSFIDREDAKRWATDLERQLREQRSREQLRHDVTAMTVRDLIREF